MYCEFDDDEHFLEFYEHGSDPWQLDNCAAKVPPAKLAGYHARLSKLRACAGLGLVGIWASVGMLNLSIALGLACFVYRSRRSPLLGGSK